MDSEKARQLDYISKVFSKLSTEKQENALKKAKSLLQLQEQSKILINVRPLPVDKKKS
jgi:hypothetical protein